MTDIRLVTLLPPPSAPAVSPPAPIPGIASQSAALILSQMALGSVLAGFIVNRDASGNPVLRTPKGDVAFASHFFLKIGSEVVIRVESHAGHSQARILTVNGQAPEVAEAQSGFAQEPEVIVGERSSPPPPRQAIPEEAVNTAGLKTAPPVFTAVLTPALSPSSAASPPAAPWVVTLRLLAPGENPLPAPPSEAEGVESETTEVVVPVRAGQVLLAGLPVQELTGGRVLHIPQGGLLRLPSDAFLPAAGQLRFEILRVAPMSSAFYPREEPVPTLELAWHWSSMQEILRLIAEAKLSLPALPTLVAADVPAVADRALPRLPQVELLFFLAALRGGDFRGWLGRDAVETLRARGHEALLAKAEQEFLSLGRLAAQAHAPHGWEPLFFPALVLGELHQLRLFMKRDGKDKARQDRRQASGDARFILEADLSRLGALQLDGFVRRREGALDFDLIIRSHAPLPEAMQREILAIYTKTGELAGYKGHMSFQSGREFPVHPMTEVFAQGSGVIA